MTDLVQNRFVDITIIAPECHVNVAFDRAESEKPGHAVVIGGTGATVAGLDRSFSPIRRRAVG
jgi:hypothetical protein